MNQPARPSLIRYPPYEKVKEDTKVIRRANVEFAMRGADPAGGGPNSGCYLRYLYTWVASREITPA